MTQLDLGAFLAQQTSAGEVESRGDFTVSHDQAARKLARFALPRSTAWVSKLVQAAVRWKCEAVQIRQSRTETLFHFTMPDLKEVPGEDAIVNGLLSGKVGGGSALDAFCLALRALVEQDKLSFLLVADNGRARPRPVYAGAYYGEISEEKRLHSRFSPRPGLSLTVHHIGTTKQNSLVDYLSVELGGGAAILRELDTYCYMSPVPLLLDGRRIDGLLSSSELKFSRSHRPLATSGLRALLNSPPTLALPLDYERKTLSFLSHPRRILRSYAGAKGFSAAYLLSFTLPNLLDKTMGRKSRRTEVLWLNDGVIVEKTTASVLTSGLALRLYVNASGLTTDLTGFTTIDNDDRRSRLMEVMLRAGRAVLDYLPGPDVDFFRADSDESSDKDKDYDVDQAFQKRVKILLRGSGTGLVLTLMAPAIGIPTTLGSIAGAYITPPPVLDTGRYADQRDQVERLLKEDLRELSNYLMAAGAAGREPKTEPSTLHFDD